MRISVRVDYAIRAMVEVAAAPGGQPCRAEGISERQGIPLKFLLAILVDLKAAHLLRSHRGRGGGYSLARPAAEISVADVARALEGPLANVHDTSLASLRYPGAAAPLREVWMAVRTSLRDVLEAVSIAQLASGRLPRAVTTRAERYRAEERRRGRQRASRTARA